MGLLTTALRILHPVRTAKRSVKRAVVPRSIRKAQSQVLSVTHPIEHLEYKAIGSIDRAITPKRRRRKR